MRPNIFMLRVLQYLKNQNLSSLQKELGEEAVDALYQVHQTVFDPINSADLCE